MLVNQNGLLLLLCESSLQQTERDTHGNEVLNALSFHFNDECHLILRQDIAC